ncbi:leucine-rich repeat-containing protein 15-like [Strongylocentrotus purpuratus]|uniref:TIR domain-containing protein n=1 Tax=Strongylocentrotus purpuratus TaxID=7668 RepID=A0A7M7T276_STRPU|nr:leucine-rich repeat-containing protein 15-like [Strongylocentrotus purpuratus]
MNRNLISDLDVGTFSPLTQLQKLVITNNKLTHLPRNMFASNQFLSILVLSGNNLSSVPTETLTTLHRLEKISLASNSIQIADFKAFTYMNNISCIDISGNQISSIWALNFKPLRNASLYKLNLSRNKLQILPQRLFSYIKEVEYLEMKSNRLQTLYLSSFLKTRSLKRLQMSHTELKAPDLFDNQTQSSFFDGLVSLERLNLSGNLLSNMSPGVFRSLTKLKVLDLSQASIVILKPELFKGLVSLTSLYLNENNILNTSAQVFSGLDNLGSLYFENSKLEFIDPDTFLKTPNLRSLFLSGNRLTKVQNDTFFPTSINHTLTIDVSANPFSCTCELSWFITWLHESNINLKHPNQTICSRTSIKEVVNLRILMFDPADFCFVNSVDSVNILLIVALSFFGVMVGFVSILAYSKRWWLNHKLFLLKLAIIGYQEMAEEFDEDNYEFHLNLMFHEAEEEWVDQVLKPGLEERLPHLQNIIYGDKDLHLGMYYVNAIFDAIDNSFKTVLLISNQSIDDPWCMTKLRMSLEHLNDTGLDKVILIFLEDIDDDHLPYLVRLFMSRNKPYMLWTENEDGQELFWAQFEKSMRANRAINNIIPV